MACARHAAEVQPRRFAGDSGGERTMMCVVPIADDHDARVRQLARWPDRRAGRRGLGAAEEEVPIVGQHGSDEFCAAIRQAARGVAWIAELGVGQGSGALSRGRDRAAHALAELRRRLDASQARCDQQKSLHERRMGERIVERELPTERAADQQHRLLTERVDGQLVQLGDAIARRTRRRSAATRAVIAKNPPQADRAALTLRRS